MNHAPDSETPEREIILRMIWLVGRLEILAKLRELMSGIGKKI